MELLKTTNQVIAFILELCMFTAFGYWGFHTHKVMIAKIIFGVGAPLLAIILWGLFAAPKSGYRIEFPYRILFELVVFALATVALYKSGQVKIAFVFFIIALLNETVAFVWKQ